MAYEIYKKILSEDKYFENWTEEQLSNLTDEHKKRIYGKYVVKAMVLQRDNFTCQNETCKYCNNKKAIDKLTMHHIKFQKNGGKDKLSNCITLCNGSHKNYHRGKTQLVLNGLTYKIHMINEINWKKVKADNKKIRKCLPKDDKGILISYRLAVTLMKWLDMPWEDIYQEEDF